MHSQRNWNIYRLTNKKLSKTNNSFQNNPRKKLISILNRISEKNPSKMTTLSLLSQKHIKSYILKLKNKNQLDFNKISEDMNNKEKELLSQINEFKKDVIGLDKNHEKILNKHIEYKKVNDFFSEMYKKIQNRKKNKQKNSFIEDKSYFSILNQYLLKNKRLPDLSKNIFNLNPLILDNYQLKKYFIYNKIDPSKFFEYLNKVKDMTERKINGNDKLSEEEKIRIEDIIKNEKPKDYVDPTILISNLKKDIAKTKNTFNNLINKNMKRTLEEPNNKNIIKRTDSSDEIKKLNSTKKIKFVNDYKNDFNNIINKSFIDSTTIPMDSKNINSITPRYDIFNRKKTQTQTNIFNSSLIIKLKRNSFNIFDVSNNELDNSNSNVEKNYDQVFNIIDAKNKNNFLKRSFNKNLKIDKELNNFSIFQNNKSELLSPNMKIDFNKFMDNFNYKQEVNQRKEQKLKDLNESLSNKTNEFNSNKNASKKINIKFDYFKKRMPIIYSKKIKKEQVKAKSQNIEKLYSKALKLKLKSKSFDDKVELENYLISKTKNQNLGEIMNLKNTYYNINKIERKFIKTNLIKEQYSLRNLKGDKINEQKQILNKNKILIKSFIENANKLRKVICQKSKNDND